MIRVRTRSRTGMCALRVRAQPVKFRKCQEPPSVSRVQTNGGESDVTAQVPTPLDELDLLQRRLAEVQCWGPNSVRDIALRFLREQLTSFSREIRSSALVAKGRQTEYHDIVLRGLVLRVTDSGSRTYDVRYRFAGQPRRLHIGDARVLTLAEARQKAREMLADAVKGSDPVELRESERRAAEEARRKSERTVRKLAKLWLESKESKSWRPRTRKEFERITNRVIVPALGDHDANLVARSNIRRLLDDIAEGQGTIGEGKDVRNRHRPAPTEANRVYATLHLLYQWLHKERQEWLGVTTHPLAGLEKPSSERPRTRTYSNHEIRALLAAAPGTELEDFLAILFQAATRSDETLR
jgi:hypothetical protein